MAEPTWFISVPASVAGANKNHLGLWNAAGSGKIIKVYKVFANGAPTAAVVGLVIPLSVYRITTIPTGGTNPGPLSAAVETALPSQITAWAAPTGGAGLEAIPFGGGTVSGEETGAAFRTPLYEFSIDGLKPVELPEGRGMMVRQGALASAGAVSIVIFFSVV